MTRFEQWIAQHNRVDLICKADFRWFCEGCILFPVCEKYKFAFSESEKEIRDEAEAYLDEEVDE